MARFDTDKLVSTAGTLRFRPEEFEMAVRLLAYLDDVRIHPKLTGMLTLRGGTAINLFLSDVPRMSIDADFNYVGSPDKSVMERDRPVVLTSLQEVGTVQGYEVRKPVNSYGDSSFYLAYQGILGAPKSMKVDVNFLLRVPLLPPQMTAAKTLMEGLSCSFLLTHPDEIHASKVKAMIERAAPRDLFDVYQLAAEGPLSDLRRRLATVFLGTLDDDPRDLTIESVSWPSWRDLKQSLHPFLKGGFGLQLKDMRARIDPLIQSLLAWDNRQRDFLGALMAGSVEGDLLFPDLPKVAEAVNALPALQWKVANLEKNKKKK